MSLSTRSSDSCCLRVCPSRGDEEKGHSRFWPARAPLHGRASIIVVFLPRRLGNQDGGGTARAEHCRTRAGGLWEWAGAAGTYVWGTASGQRWLTERGWRARTWARSGPHRAGLRGGWLPGPRAALVRVLPAGSHRHRASVILRTPEQNITGSPEVGPGSGGGGGSVLSLLQQELNPQGPGGHLLPSLSPAGGREGLSQM